MHGHMDVKLCNAFVLIFNQTLSMQTARLVSTSDKYLTSYGRDEQTN